MRPWWECGVIYEVRPRCFQDSDGDGIGDLAGIEQRLDHIAKLGVDAIQLSTIFAPAMAEHRAVDPLVGDLISFDRLAAAVHARGLKLILDFDAEWQASGTQPEAGEVLRFWQDRGVDGFRLDTLRHVGETVSIPANPLTLDQITRAWTPAALRTMIAEGEAARPAFGWASRAGSTPEARQPAPRPDPAQARLAAMLLLTLRGTPIIRQGDELGLNGVDGAADEGGAPMPWDGSAFAGFSRRQPWLPLSPDWQTDNVRVQAGDPESMLAFYRSLLALRRGHRALSIGWLGLLGGGNMVAYERRHWDDRLLVALNLGDEACSIPVPPGAVLGETLLSTLPKQRRGGALAPHEGRVIRLL